MSATELSLDQLADWLRRFAQIVDENKTYLTELDSAIGDADHGANMARGTAAVVTHLDEANTIDALLKKAGMTLVSTVGGTSGPLYGTLLMKMGMATGAVTELSAEEFSKAFRAGLEGLVARGKTELGDKTMVMHSPPPSTPTTPPSRTGPTCTTPSNRPPRRPPPVAMPPPRSWRARVGPATSANAPRVTWTPEPPRRPTCSMRSPK